MIDYTKQNLVNHEEKTQLCIFFNFKKIKQKNIYLTISKRTDTQKNKYKIQ